ncbi:MAG: PaaI family thioesterase [bacterium]|nr:PaaI family thioesterase [bacterium]
MRGLAFQDYMEKNYCFCCGSWNERGLRIKSFWDKQNPEEAVCEWKPEPWHGAGSGQARYILNGGIMLGLMDGHSVCTALADAYRREGREIGSCPKIWYVTAGWERGRFLKPTSLVLPVTLRARVKEIDRKQTIVECTLFSEGVSKTTPVDFIAFRADHFGQE